MVAQKKRIVGLGDQETNAFKAPSPQKLVLLIHRNENGESCHTYQYLPMPYLPTTGLEVFLSVVIGVQ